MSAHACERARAQLAAWIEGGAHAALEGELAAHLAGCAACGAWTRGELALERLLGAEASAPRADAFLARRVLERLSAARASASATPAGAPRDALDALLARLPAPAIAADFERELLRALAPARARARRVEALRLWGWRAGAAACALTLLAGAWSLRAAIGVSSSRSAAESAELASAAGAAELADPPLELLEQLELLEDWELVAASEDLAFEHEGWHEAELAFWGESEELEAPRETEAGSAASGSEPTRATEGG